MRNRIPAESRAAVIACVCRSALLLLLTSTIGLPYAEELLRCLRDKSVTPSATGLQHLTRCQRMQPRTGSLMVLSGR